MLKYNIIKKNITNRAYPFPNYTKCKECTKMKAVNIVYGPV
jgi:hypothetical protein